MYRYEIMSMDAVDLSRLQEDINLRAKRGLRLVQVLETRAEPSEAVPDGDRRPVVLFIFEEEIDNADPAGA